MALWKKMRELSGGDLPEEVFSRQRRQIRASRIFCLALFLVSVVVVMAI